MAWAQEKTTPEHQLFAYRILLLLRFALHPQENFGAKSTPTNFVAINEDP
jgi:hypothetical protein